MPSIRCSKTGLTGPDFALGFGKKRNIGLKITRYEKQGCSFPPAFLYPRISLTLKIFQRRNDNFVVKTTKFVTSIF